MKKFFSLVLALVMALSLTTVAWGAAQTYEVATPEALLNLFDGDPTNTEVADGDTVKLTANVALPEASGLLKINGQKVFLDLNGKTLSRVNTGGTANTIVYVATGELTIKDSATGGKVDAGDGQMALQVYGGTTVLESGSLVSTNLRTLVVRYDAEFVMNGGAISCATDTAVFVRGDATFTMNAGTVSGGTYGIATNNTEPSPTISVLGGSVTGTNDAGIFLSTGTLTVSGGSVSGATGIYVKTGTVAISGDAVVSGTGAAAAYQYKGDGMYSTGDALVIDNCGYSGGAPVVSVTGGTFSSANADAVASYVGNGETDKVDEFIEGGTFSGNVDEALLADGLDLVQDTNGNYVPAVVPAMGDKFDLYQADAGMAAALKAKTPDVAGLSFTEVAAKTNKDGSGNVAYIAANNGQFFVKTSAPTVSDYAVTDAGKTTVLYYVTVAGTDAANFAYEASVTAFNKFSTYDKCGYVTGAPAANAVYFQTAAGDVYLAGAAGTGINYLLNGKVVSAAAAQTVVDHVFVANGYKYDSVKKVNVPTSALCTKCLTTSTAIYLDGKAPAQSTVKELTTDTAYCVVVGAVSSAPVVGGTTSSTVQSAQTFDAGIAMYVGMSVMAACGSAVVIGKKKD